MSWQERIERNVQARIDSAVHSNSLQMSLSKGHLSPSLSESEPEHHSDRVVVYEPVISKAHLIEIMMTEQGYRRSKH